MKLTRVEPHELDAKDVSFLAESAAQADEPWKDIVEAIVGGRATLWRIEGRKAHGILLVEIRNGMLYVWHMAGEHLWREYRSIILAVQELVQRNGLKGIQGQSIPTVAKLLKRCGFKSPFSVMEWRNPNG